MPDEPQGQPDGDGQPPADGNGQPPTEPRTFTQDEVNAIVRQRAERMLRQQTGDDVPLDQLGDLLGKARQFDALQEEQKTELQRAQEAAEQAAARATELEATLRNRDLADLVVQHASGKLANPRAAVKLADLATIDPDDPATVDAAITKVLEEYPEFAANDRPPPVPSADGGARNSAAGGDFNSMIRRSLGR